MARGLASLVLASRVSDALTEFEVWSMHLIVAVVQSLGFRRRFGGRRGRSGRRKSQNSQIFRSKVGVTLVGFLDVSVKFEQDWCHFEGF